MSRIKSGLYQLLLSNGPVNGYVNGSIHFSLVPKGGTYPANVIHSIVAVPEVAIERTLSLIEGRFQIDSLATEPLIARRLSRAVRELLEDFTGTLYDGTVVESCAVNTEFDEAYEPGATAYLYRTILDLSIWYAEQ